MSIDYKKKLIKQIKKMAGNDVTEFNFYKNNYKNKKTDKIDFCITISTKEFLSHITELNSNTDKLNNEYIEFCKNSDKYDFDIDIIQKFLKSIGVETYTDNNTYNEYVNLSSDFEYITFDYKYERYAFISVNDKNGDVRSNYTDFYIFKLYYENYITMIEIDNVKYEVDTEHNHIIKNNKITELDKLVKIENKKLISKKTGNIAKMYIDWFE